MKEQEQKKLSQIELNEKIKLHELWLKTSQKEGETLTLSNYNLSNLSFNNAHLVGANLSKCTMDNCDFSHANLESINITESTFHGTNFYKAVLKKVDAKYIKVDDNTNFEEVIYEGMIIDSSSSDFLPVFLDKNVMQIVEEYRLTFTLQVERSTSHIVKGMFDDLEEILTDKYNEEVKITSNKDGYHKLNFLIEASNPTIIEKIKQDVFDFQRFLRGDKTIHQLTDDPILQERLRLNQRYREFQLEHQKFLVQELGIAAEQAIAQTLPQLAFQLAAQLRNNLLPVGPQKNAHADCIVILPNGNKKPLDADKVIFIEKLSGEYPRIYTIDQKEGFEVDELMTRLATELSKVIETIITTHKSYIVNLKFLNQKENFGNNYKIYSNLFPEKELLVGQNHKKLFNERIIKHGIILESK